MHWTILLMQWANQFLNHLRNQIYVNYIYDLPEKISTRNNFCQIPKQSLSTQPNFYINTPIPSYRQEYLGQSSFFFFYKYLGNLPNSIRTIHIKQTKKSIQQKNKQHLHYCPILFIYILYMYIKNIFKFCYLIKPQYFLLLLLI